MQAQLLAVRALSGIASTLPCVKSYCISKAICVYTKTAALPCINVYTRMYRVLFYCTVLVDAAARLLIVRVLYVVIYRHSRLYVSVFIVSFILYI